MRYCHGYSLTPYKSVLNLAWLLTLILNQAIFRRICTKSLEYNCGNILATICINKMIFSEDTFLVSTISISLLILIFVTSHYQFIWSMQLPNYVATGPWGVLPYIDYMGIGFCSGIVSRARPTFFQQFLYLSNIRRHIVSCVCSFDPRWLSYGSRYHFQTILSRTRHTNRGNFCL